MTMQRSKKLFFAMLLTTGLASCVTHVHKAYQHGPVPTVGVGITFYQKAPPARKRETRPPRPVEHAVWIDGFWSHSGVGYDWRDGYWEREPKTRNWQRGTWIHTDRGWYRTQGEWVTW